MCEERKLETKEILDLLKFISQTNRSLHNERIKHELHVVLTTVTFFLLCISFKYTHALPKDPSFNLYLWIGIAIIIIIAGKYIAGSADANTINQTVAEKAEDRILETLKTNSINIEYKADTHPNKFRSWWQILIIVLAGILSGLIITLQ